MMARVCAVKHEATQHLFTETAPDLRAVMAPNGRSGPLGLQDAVECTAVSEQEDLRPRSDACGSSSGRTQPWELAGDQETELQIGASHARTKLVVGKQPHDRSRLGEIEDAFVAKAVPPSATRAFWLQ